jgi:hypothetical protein
MPGPALVTEKKMVRIGRTNNLTIKETQDYGILLDGGEAGDIFLKDATAARKYHPGDSLDAFIYVDREQRLVATARKPFAEVGEFAALRVVASTKTGAFLDWGLENDLFAPKSEQQENMREGKSYVVCIFLSEKHNRITASSKLTKFLDLQPPQYTEGEEVDLLLYAGTDLGYSAVVNGAHSGMIYENEVFRKLFIGQRLKGYVKKIREDHKIDLRLQQTGYQQVDDISQAVLDTIKGSGGLAAVTDKSPPEEIYAMFGVSKKVFKKAIGALYKKRLILIDTDGIRLAG